MAVMGLDVGSTGCKTILFDENGSQLAYAYKEYKSSGSVFEVDANEIWRCVCEVIKSATSENNSPVLALAVSSFGESFVAVDENGNVQDSTMLYSDPRGIEECNQICSEFGEENIMKITGVKPHIMYSLPKIYWFRKNKKSLFDKTKSFLLIEDFIIYKLCGEKSIDYSLASRTMAFNIIKKKWEESLLSFVGIDTSYMSSPVPSGTIVGKVVPKIANELGLSKDTLIVTGAHDQICVATGSGVLSEGYAIDSIGTVECITPVFEKALLDIGFLESGFACVPYSIDGIYATYAVNFTGGSILKWYRDNFAKLEHIQSKEKGISVYEQLDNNAPTAPTNIIAVPHFAGSGTPNMNPNSKGAFFGLTLDTNDSTLYKAILEGIAYEMMFNIECLRKYGINIKTLKASGGGARSSVWLQIKADITGIPITPLANAEGGATGAAMLAAVACGIYPDLESAAKNFVNEKETIMPNKLKHDIYLELYENYKKAREFTINGAVK